MNVDDLNISYTRGSGPGGQHKNKVETCVVIVHVPTNTKERCQDTRSRARNLSIALDRLKKKLEKKQNEQLKKLKAEQRIDLIKHQTVTRTYNYTRNEVYDHRTKTKHDLKKFMKGEIDI